ncbi:riboflavin synthase [Ralstonia solanacearum]|uniref:riboflavin synthase n=1 Tax=Ralstonia solanacearum TaxID=305 RepID=UPI0001816BA7|nr:riboflavin synthase [Ralstonia solanacearum]MDC6177782.1 riboflavin synthase [Ralstonia solanacearum]MDC6208652.1 riboflavin synthase [Ralstonia solanacearum]MDC6238093.1 riboflavin synthase [Ralstonia solanacearum]MDD7801512.1 riboflavin synthase [Ralstonia solanacearum]TYZ56634.1 riboflavin synthase [Ralstonia solanacearum]
MFTGIVAAIGRIETITPLAADAQAGVRLSIHAGGLPLADVVLGDSIAIQGACMTVIARTDTHFDVDVSRESLSKTVGLDHPGEVNLEKALRLADHIGGHLVSGHVDGLGTVSHFAPVGESYELRVRTSPELGRYFAYKGSVVVNGVSLTVNSVRDDAAGCEFSINLIPHTLAVTTLKHLAAGGQVNLEIDLIARYVERMLTHAATGLPAGARPLAAV